jgi:hypothetical protein
LLDTQQIAKKALYGLSGIYACVHIETGTSYIGSSVNLADRIMDHIHNNSYNLHLQNAIDKYGLSHFAFVILEYCLSSDIIKREQLYLDILFSLPAYLRYNFAKFAEAPFTGLTHTPETRAQMRDSHTGKTHSEETRAQMSDSRTGKTHTPETRAKMSDSRRGKSHSDETRTLMSEAHTGKSHSTETRAKISEALTGANHPMYGKVPAHAMTINVYSLALIMY